MPSLIIYSDAHIHLHKKIQFGTARLEDCLEAQDWVFREAVSRNVKNVIFAGDLFHDRQKIDILSYQRAFEIFEKYQNLNIWLLIGNHDMWQNEKWEISSVVPLSAMKNVRIVNKPCTIEIDGFPVSFLPYTKSPIDSLASIENYNPYRMLVGHVAIDGALLNSRADIYADESVEYDGDMIKVNVGIFKGWNRVFLGHYHAAQKLSDNVEYIGSPLQVTYNEAFQKKHIILFNTDSHETEYIENDFSPRHFICKSDEIDSTVFRERDFVRVQVDQIASTENLELQKNLKKKNLSEVKIEPSKNKIQEEKEVVVNAKALLYDESVMAKTFVDTVGPKGLNREKLLETFDLIRKRKENSEHV